MIAIPATMAINCVKAVLKEYFSLCSSGSKSAPAIYMNPPTVNGIKNVNFCDPAKAKTNTAPIIEVNADRKLNNNAFAFENHEYNKTAKSPISCGISCSKTANVVANPISKLNK